MAPLLDGPVFCDPRSLRMVARRPWKLGRLKVLLPKWLGMVVCWRLGTLETFGHFAHSTGNKINIFLNHWWASHWFWVSLCLSRTSSGRWGHIWPHSISYHHILVINFFVSAKITQNPKIWIWAQKLTEWRRYIRKLNQNRNPFNFFCWRISVSGRVAGWGQGWPPKFHFVGSKAWWIVFVGGQKS